MPTTKPLIAVVDDDYSVLRSLARLLRSVGYAVETFGSAQEFLVWLATSLPTCLVLDVQMPGMSGLELQSRLRNLGCAMPIVFITAHDTPQTREQTQRAGSLGLLLKPFSKQALLGAIREAVSVQSHEPVLGEGQTQS